MKKLEIESNFHNPNMFIHSIIYKSLFDHDEVVAAFSWASVDLEDFFEKYYLYNTNEKEAKKSILKVFACAPE